MNLPNVLTVSRIVLTVIFLFLIQRLEFHYIISAILVFCLASLTDFLDGYIARKKNLITVFGKIMDPIADKFLTLSAFYVMTMAQVLPIWMFLIVLIREVGQTTLRLFAMKRKVVLQAENIGKYKTVCQLLSIFLFLLWIFLEAYIVNVVDAGSNHLQVVNNLMMIKKIMLNILNLSIYVMFVLTVVSGVSFLSKNWRV